MKVGDIWRKRGPVGWLKIVRIQMPGFTGYDGALPGCSVRFTNINGKWERNTWFFPAASESDFAEKMRESFRFKAAGTVIEAKENAK